MLPEVVDGPTITRGDGWSWPIELFSDQALSTPIDLTAYGSTWAARAVGGGVSVDFAVNIDDAATGRLVLSLTHTQTRSLPADSRITYDLQASGTGEPVTLMRGQILVQDDITP